MSPAQSIRQMGDPQPSLPALILLPRVRRRQALGMTRPTAPRRTAGTAARSRQWPPPRGVTSLTFPRAPRSATPIADAGPVGSGVGWEALPAEGVAVAGPALDGGAGPGDRGAPLVEVVGVLRGQRGFVDESDDPDPATTGARSRGSMLQTLTASPARARRRALLNSVSSACCGVSGRVRSRLSDRDSRSVWQTIGSDPRRSPAVWIAVIAYGTPSIPGKRPAKNARADSWAMHDKSGNARARTSSARAARRFVAHAGQDPLASQEDAANSFSVFPSEAGDAVMEIPTAWRSCHHGLPAGLPGTGTLAKPPRPDRLQLLGRAADPA